MISHYTMMKFIPKLGDFLLQNGSIYTVREYYYTVNEVYVQRVGICHRDFIKEVYGTNDLIPYVVDSGFNSADEWNTKIMSFIRRNGVRLNLYRVIVIKPEVGKVSNILKTLGN